MAAAPRRGKFVTSEARRATVWPCGAACGFSTFVRAPSFFWNEGKPSGLGEPPGRTTLLGRLPSAGRQASDLPPAGDRRRALSLSPDAHRNRAAHAGVTGPPLRRDSGRQPPVAASSRRAAARLDGAVCSRFSRPADRVGVCVGKAARRLSHLPLAFQLEVGKRDSTPRSDGTCTAVLVHTGLGTQPSCRKDITRVKPLHKKGAGQKPAAWSEPPSTASTAVILAAERNRPARLANWPCPVGRERPGGSGRAGRCRSSVADRMAALGHIR